MALALGLTCAFAVACGEERTGLISAERAADIKAQLDNIDEDVRSERCTGALTDHLASLSRQVSDLPGTVDADLRRTLRDGVDRLQDQAPAECAPPETTTTPTDTTPTETVPTIPPETTPTETVPPETTPTEPTPTEPVEPTPTEPVEPTPTTPAPTPTTPSGGEEAPEGQVIE